MLDFLKHKSRCCFTGAAVLSLMLALSSESNAQEVFAYNGEKTSDKVAESNKSENTSTVSTVLKSKKYPAFSIMGDTLIRENSEFMKNLTVGGVFRFITYYRNMDQMYDYSKSMIGSEKSLSFTDYPFSPGAVAQGAYPMVELALSSRIKNNADFNIGYSFAHFFTIYSIYFV